MFLKEFMDNSPSLIQIVSEIEHYDSVEQEIDDIKPFIQIESIELSTGKLVMMCLGNNWVISKV